MSKAVHVVRPGEGEAYWSLGNLITFKVGPQLTNGQWSIAEMTVVPGGGPPPHLHRREDETFYVLEGEMRFLFEDRVYLARPGDAFFLPRNKVHTFHNPGKTPAKALVMTAPCGFEKFMMNSARPKSESIDPPPVRKEDIDKLLSAAPQYGIEIKFDHKPSHPPQPAKSTHKSVSVMGNQVEMHLMSKDTNNAFTCVTLLEEPGAGVPPHTHREMDELFYIVAGKYEYTIEGKPLVAEAGTTIYVPRGISHGFKNVGNTPGRIADFHFPGGFENFFLELATADQQSGGAMENSDVVKLFDKHGMDLVV
jgi:quercetin dioxygenase-like cupin family protein